MTDYPNSFQGLEITHTLPEWHDYLAWHRLLYMRFTVDIANDNPLKSIMKRCKAKRVVYEFKQNSKTETLLIYCAKNDPAFASMRADLTSRDSKLARCVNTVISKLPRFNGSFEALFMPAIPLPRLQRGVVSTFYSSAIAANDPHDPFFATFPQLGRFVRRLRNFGVVDMVNLIDCQSIRALESVPHYQCVLNIAGSLLQTPPAIENRGNVTLGAAGSYMETCWLKDSISPLLTSFYLQLSNVVKSQEGIPNYCQWYLTTIFSFAAGFKFQYRFPVNISLREERTNGSLYTAILLCSLHGADSDLNISNIAEFNLGSLTAYVSDHYADIATVVTIGVRSIPTFIGEYGTDFDDKTAALAERNVRITQGQNLVHKDRSRDKLIGAMSASLLEIVALLFVKKEQLCLEACRKVFVWGLLVDSWKFVFLRLQIHLPDEYSFAQFKENKFDMLLCSGADWTIHLQESQCDNVIANPLHFFKGLLDIWNISCAIKLNSQYVATLIHSVASDVDSEGHSKNTGAPIGIRFPVELEAMPQSISYNRHFETPRKKQNNVRNEILDEIDESMGSDSDSSSSSTTSEPAASLSNRIKQPSASVFSHQGNEALKKSLNILEKEQDFIIETIGTVDQRKERTILNVASKNNIAYVALVKPALRGYKECELLSKVDSKYVISVKYHEILQDLRWILIVEPKLLDHCQHTFFSVVLCRDPVVRFRNAVALCYDAICAVLALHEKLILHRDLKPSHFLYNEWKKCWVLIDLDSAIQLTSQDEIITDDLRLWSFGPPGTAGFQAPEVEQRKGYGLKADNYSLGRTLSSIFNSNYTFDHRGVARPIICDTIQEELNRLLICMKHWDPSERISLQVAFEKCQELLSLFDESSENENFPHTFNEVNKVECVV